MVELMLRQAPGNASQTIAVNNELRPRIAAFIFFDFANDKIASTKDGIIGVHNGGGLKTILRTSLPLQPL